MSHLKKAGIGTGIHYPVPLHLQRAYVSLNYCLEDFPVSRRVAGEIVSLPMFPQLTAEQQTRVAEEVQAFTSKDSKRPKAGDLLMPEDKQHRNQYSKPCPLLVIKMVFTEQTFDVHENEK